MKQVETLSEIDKNDFKQVAIAVQGLKELETKTTVNGTNVSATVDQNGNIGHYNQDSSATYAAGTKINFNSVDSLLGTALNPGDSSSKVAVMGVTKDVISSVASFVTRRVKSAQDETLRPASELPKGTIPNSPMAKNYRRFDTKDGRIFVKKEGGENIPEAGGV